MDDDNNDDDENNDNKKKSKEDDDNNNNDDEMMRKLLKPNPTKDDIIKIVKEYYSNNNNNNINNNNEDNDNTDNIEIIRQLDSYDDINYQMKINNRMYLLKIHNGVESNDYINRSSSSSSTPSKRSQSTKSKSSQRNTTTTTTEEEEADMDNDDILDNDYYKRGCMTSVIHFQNAIMETLRRNNIPTYTSITPTTTTKTRSSSSSSSTKRRPNVAPLIIVSLPVVSEKHSPCRLVIRLLEWIEGHPMSSLSILPIETLGDAGRFLGKMNHAFDDMVKNLPTSSLRALRKSESEGFMLRKNAKLAAAAAALLNDMSENSHMSVGSENAKTLDNNNNNSENNKKVSHPPAVVQPDVVILHDDSSVLTGGHRYHQWDGKNTLQLRQYLDCITNPKQRTLVENVIHTFDDEIIQSGDYRKFRTGIIHADYNDANILIDTTTHHNNIYKVCGVIDFGDSVESWRILDLSVAMAYSMLSTYGKNNRSISAAAAMLRGYNAIYPLTDIERKHLLLLIACRLTCSVVLGAYSYQQNPTNHYLLLHAKPAWNALELIWGYSGSNIASSSSSSTSTTANQQQQQRRRRELVADAIHRVFDQACLYTTNIKHESVIECADLVMPDPGVTDLLASIRVQSCSGENDIDTNRTSISGTNKRKRDPGEKEGDEEDAIVEPAAVDDDNNDEKVGTNTASNDVDDDGCARITFVTGNAKKLEEVQRILGLTTSSSTVAASASGTTTGTEKADSTDETTTSSSSSLPYHLTNMKVDLPELQGDPLTVAREKCRIAVREVKGPVIVEDTSLCFNAYNGLPGVYIKWFLDSIGHIGLNKMLDSYKDKTAYAQTVVAFCPGPKHEDDIAIFDGRTMGKIVMPRGSKDFGWDPIFEPTTSNHTTTTNNNNNKTYAEMTKDEKDTISHRSRAFKQFREYLDKSRNEIISKIHTQK